LVLDLDKQPKLLLIINEKDIEYKLPDRFYTRVKGRLPRKARPVRGLATFSFFFAPDARRGGCRARTQRSGARTRNRYFCIRKLYNHKTRLRLRARARPNLHIHKTYIRMNKKKTHLEGKSFNPAIEESLEFDDLGIHMAQHWL
jgi:hypothetical protein